MSLLAWYPLEKDYKNYGLVDGISFSTNTPTYTAGKTGSNAHSGSYTYSWTAAQTAKVLKHTFSYCCWFKVINTTNRNVIFGNDGIGGAGNSNNRHYAIMQYPTANDLYCSWQIDATSSAQGATALSGRWDGFFPTGQWVHLAITYGDGEFKLYRNGALYSTNSNVNITPSSIATFAYPTTVFRPNTSAAMNDVRIYDHVLSQEEIHNIYNSLIVHYPFNDPEETGLTNLYQNYKNGWRDSLSGFTATAMEENGYKFTRYTFTYTGTGTSNWFWLAYPYFSFTAGKRYWYSCKVRVNSMASTTAFYFRSARMGNDYDAASKRVEISSSKVGSGWYTISAYQDLQATSTRSGTSNTTNPRIEFYTNDIGASGEVFSMSIDIRDVCVCECPYGSFTGYVDNTYMSRTICDVSGHKNNGTLVGTSIITSTKGLSGKMPINYSYSTGGNYARIDYQAGKVTDEITVAIWAYRDNWDSGDYRLVSCTEAGGWNFERTNNTNGLRWIVYASGDYRRCTGVTGITAGWHHFVGTWDGKQAKYYIDGVLKSSSTALSTKTPITYHTGNYVIIGAEAGTSNTADGSISNEFLNDLRIYASALSADDVRQLYSVRGKIDNLGNVYDFGYSYDNANPNPKFTANGRCMAGQHKEIDYPYPYGTNSALRTEPDGSIWMKIFHHNNPASKLFAQTDPFTTRFIKDDDRWADFSIFNQLTSFELMGIICATSGGTTYKYRWIQPVNPLTATWAQVAAASTTIITTSGYTSTNWGGLWKINGSTYLCQNNGSESHWWGAVGAWKQHAGGIPGLNNIVVTTGYEDLYVRIDGGRLKRPSEINANIGKGGLRGSFITANNFYEI